MKRVSQSILMAAVICSSMSLLTSVYAEEMDGTVHSFTLDEVVVTATRTPVEAFKANANVSVVTRKKIEERHYNNALDALRDIPGVTIAGYGNTGEVYSSNSLILNGSDKIIVLIDGVRANINGSSGTYGKMAISELSNMDAIERIEVLKSSASTLYGADAAGGVINIITRKPHKMGVKTKLTASSGSFSKELYKLSHRGSKDGFYWELFGQKRIAGDFKDGWKRKIPEHLNSVTNAYKIGKHFGDTADLNITYQTYTSDYLRPTGGYDAAVENMKQGKFNIGEKKNNKLNINYEQTINDKLTNQLSLYRHQHAADEVTWNKKLTKQQPYIYHYTTRGLSDQITYRPDERHIVVGGFEWYEDRVDHYRTSATSEYSGKKTNNKAIYLNDEFKFTDTWNVSYGIRYNDSSTFGAKWLPSITLGNTPNERLNYFIGYKKFFVAPYPSQMYGQYGTPTLNAESGRAIEGGLNYRFDNSLTGSIHAFQRKMNDTIEYDSGIKKYVNTGEEDARGFDIQMRKAFGKHFTADVGYTYTYIKPTGPNSNPNSNGRIPRSAWNVDLGYNIDKFNADLVARGTIAKQGGKSKSYGDNTSEEASSYHTYWIFDLSMNYRATKAINIFAKCNNIFDRLYTEQRACLLPVTGTSWYSAPGRNFEVGVEYTF